jgi:hypothetical protein
MRKIKWMALGLGLVFTALHSNGAAAESRCEIECRRQYAQCLIICSKNPCLVSCETVLQICLNNCGSES